MNNVYYGKSEDYALSKVLKVHLHFLPHPDCFFVLPNTQYRQTLFEYQPVSMLACLSLKYSYYSNCSKYPPISFSLSINCNSKTQCRLLPFASGRNMSL